MSKSLNIPGQFPKVSRRRRAQLTALVVATICTPALILSNSSAVSADEANQGDANIVLSWRHSGGNPPSQEIIRRLTDRANHDATDAEAIFCIALIENSNLPENPATNHTRWMARVEQAAKLGYGPARARLGLMEVLGEGVKANPEEGRKLIDSELANGDVDAPIYLADAMTVGPINTRGDPDQIHKALMEGLKRGNTRAYIRLFDLLIKSRREQQALSMIEKGASAGDGESMSVLAQFKLRGELTSRDLTASFTLASQAAPRGSLSAQFLLGRMYREGLGCACSPELAMKWLATASGFGDCDAKRMLGEMHLFEEMPAHDKNAGISLLNEAADLGDDRAAFTLGRLYLQGLLLPRDIPKAKEYLKRASLGPYGGEAAAMLSALGRRE